MHWTQRHDHASTKTAIIDSNGVYSYADLSAAAAQWATLLLADRDDLEESRVAILIPPSFTYVAVQWGIWQAGGVVVPLCPQHPINELQYALTNSDSSIVVVHLDYREKITQCSGKKNLRIIDATTSLPDAATELPAITEDRRSVILYTSGTTSRPKGVVTTHQNIETQITDLIDAWEWTATDHILHFLPLHHIHGIINVLSCALYAGAICEFLPKFGAAAVWTRLTQPGISLFMAVPTIYSRMIQHWQAASTDEQKRLTDACRALRLMVSGSVALPVATFNTWQQISGHTLLERYGMTEIGMALSNPLHGERRPGFVGFPLKSVQIRRVSETGERVASDVPGEIEVKGPGIFKEYWNQPEATAKAFRDGWFRTGDIAVEENGSFRILGRTSVDIIKTGGYKVSALEIEEVLRTHPKVIECAIIGIPDEEWGERVAASAVLKPEATLELTDLRAWAKAHLATYKIPSRLDCVSALPRNAMGKVQKNIIKKSFPTSSD
ncbi:MAG: Long-chain-fatty-acid--CoA ligase [Verrucomicrobia subdivision 3 bacterium]|nr:Long-chain-fatty-acid--CoA ligase [Limisphaerales bacterium]MCS1416118.1 Long-chain-fatty-acid--CoA ligase [Limisphaerales bacterium]